jgi:L-seryl-tRNA(Ser) seleniumtransferase
MAQTDAHSTQKARSTQDVHHLLRELPSVDELVKEIRESEDALALSAHHITTIVREELEVVRTVLLQGDIRGILDGNARETWGDWPGKHVGEALHAGGDGDAATLNTVLRSHILRRITALLTPSLRPAVNASGIILHTNLGRSVLAPQAVEAVCAAARGYSTLEYDTASASRGSRHNHYETLLCTLTGAEAALAVNNNAAAVLLVLAEFARGREVVVSRGELVEIGDSFRIPQIMEQSGARMVEVGTTNKTHLADYERALGGETGLIVKVHPSNFRVMGFAQSVSSPKLAALAHSRGLVFYEDYGAGAVIDLNLAGGFAKAEAEAEDWEPTVAQLLRSGCDLVSFSGDKLMGGPQAGLIVGKAELIGRLKGNPLARALRIDKLSLAALEATLRLYLDEDLAKSSIPTLKMLGATPKEVLPGAEQLATMLLNEPSVKQYADVCVLAGHSLAGGGSLPLSTIPTHIVALKPRQGSAEGLARHLAAQSEPPVIARVNDGQILFDARTLLDSSDWAAVVRGVSDYFCLLDKHYSRPAGE